MFITSMMKRYQHTRVQFNHHRIGLCIIGFITKLKPTEEASIRLFMDNERGSHIVLSEVHGFCPKFSIDQPKATLICMAAVAFLENKINALRLIQDNLRVLCT